MFVEQFDFHYLFCSTTNVFVFVFEKQLNLLQALFFWSICSIFRSAAKSSLLPEYSSEYLKEYSSTR